MPSLSAVPVPQPRPVMSYVSLGLTPNKTFLKVLLSLLHLSKENQAEPRSGIQATRFFLLLED